MKNSTNTILFSLVLTAFLSISIISVPAFVSAQSPTPVPPISNGGDDVLPPASSPGPNSGVNNGGDDIVIVGGGGNSGVRNGDDDIVVPNPPSNPPTNNPGNTNTSSGGGSGGGNSGGSSGNLPGRRHPILLGQATGTFSTTSTCALVTGALRRGWKNNDMEVTKLQAFLRNNEGMNVMITGTFDAQTEAAVKAFQRKYADTILAPWGAKETGFVYITTMKKINQLACATPLMLSNAELAIINGTKVRMALVRSQTNVATSVTRPATPVVTVGSAPTTPASPTATVVASNPTPTATTVTASTDRDRDSSNVAAAGSTSFTGRFWQFVQNLFR